MKLHFKSTGYAVAAMSMLFLVGCTKANLHTQTGRFSYAIGVQIAKNMKRQGLDLDSAAFSAGVADVYSGKQLQLSDQDRMSALRDMSETLQKKHSADATANLQKGNAFLAQNKTKPGWKVTASGLQYLVVRKGKGAKPTKTDTVVVNYEGSLIDGTVFDSSYKRGQPATFPVGAVIPGWTEALQLMRPGSEYQLAIPSSLGYGPMGGGGKIPPNSVLLFKVELLKVMANNSHAGEMRHHGVHPHEAHHRARH